MAHKTFISYKYSESRELRDRIINALGDDAQYYQGENGFSPNMSDDKDETIWNYLKDMIWGTSVTIVIISPHMTESDYNRIYNCIQNYYKFSIFTDIF